MTVEAELALLKEEAVMDIDQLRKKFNIKEVDDPARKVPKIEEHVPASFFSLEFSLDTLVSFWDVVPLHEQANFFFERKVRIFAEVLRCAKVEVPEAVLYHILPYLWGDKVAKFIVKDAVVEVSRLLSKRTTVATLTEVKN